MSETETHLGGGVCASFDGYRVWLRATLFGVDQRIGLGPEVFNALVKYADALKARTGEPHD